MIDNLNLFHNLNPFKPICFIIHIYINNIYLCRLLLCTKRNPPSNIVNDAQKGEMKIVPFKSQVFRSGITIQIFKVGKRSFYRVTNLTFLLISFLLTFRKRSPPTSFVKDSVINTSFSEIRLNSVIVIGLVRKYRGFVTTNQFLSLLRIMRTRCGKDFLPDNVGALVYTNVSFITIKCLFTF